MLAWDAETERRQRRLSQGQELYPPLVRLMVWVLCIVVAAGCWGLALTAGRWLWLVTGK